MYKLGFNFLLYFGETLQVLWLYFSSIKPLCPVEIKYGLDIASTSPLNYYSSDYILRLLIYFKEQKKEQSLFTKLVI